MNLRGRFILSFCLLAFIFSSLQRNELSLLTKAEQLDSIEAHLSAGVQSLNKLQTLYNLTVRSFTQKVTQDSILKDALKQNLNTPESRQRAHTLINEQLNDWLKSKQKKDSSEYVIHPYVLIAVDAQGKCIAHTHNPRCHQVTLNSDAPSKMLSEFPALTDTLKGQTHHDLSILDHRALTVGFAPIMDQTRVIGAIIVGFDLNQAAKMQQKVISLDVGFLPHERLGRSSSLHTKIEEQLSQKLAQSGKDAPVNEMLEVNLEKETLLLEFGRVGGYYSHKPLRFLVAKSYGKHLSNQAQIHQLLTRDWLIFSSVILMLFLWFFSLYQAPLKYLEVIISKLHTEQYDPLTFWLMEHTKDNGISKSLAEQVDLLICTLTGRPKPNDHLDEE